MPLKVDLKPKERFILGNAVVTNHNHRTTLYIEGDAPVLRSKDILGMKNLDTKTKMLYMVIQLMYIEDDVFKYQEQFLSIIEELIEENPLFFPYTEEIVPLILEGSYYKALKCTKSLIMFEKELLNEKSNKSLSESPASNH